MPLTRAIDNTRMRSQARVHGGVTIHAWDMLATPVIADRSDRRPIAQRRADRVGWRHSQPQKGKAMNKQELADAVAAKTGGSKAATGEAIDAFIDAVTAAVKR
ncbi:hypothetical protein GCM10011400_72430 [Paraburkholderia caffeinilytica]|uniref:Uncharacterized protein n=1 Tax=Paraburkholderia caffeinilytica TaxID=1761016 RepID=A0ABQ1NGP9_9BURK|nr:hypothetical protein GCM10011400_72430 [Paraburkholderia caffeinilytica]